MVCKLAYKNKYLYIILYLILFTIDLSAQDNALEKNIGYRSPHSESYMNKQCVLDTYYPAKKTKVYNGSLVSWRRFDRWR